MFIEVTVTRGADFIVTGNLKHFQEELSMGVCVVSPRLFLDALLTRQRNGSACWAQASAYVDMTGNRKLLAHVHRYTAQQLISSYGVRITHWDM